MTKDDSKNKFARIIQKYLEKLPLIILGTGVNKRSLFFNFKDVTINMN
jgi:hypothetical protein